MSHLHAKSFNLRLDFISLLLYLYYINNIKYSKILESTPSHPNQNRGKTFLMINNKKYKKGKLNSEINFSLPFFSLALFSFISITSKTLMRLSYSFQLV